MFIRPLAAILSLSMLSACATDWAHNVYEGVRQRQEAVPDPTRQPVTQPDYQQYKREVDKLKEPQPAP